MCLRRRYIVNSYTGRRLSVKCGKCPACLQEKAINRTNRIRNNYDAVNKSCLVLFCTFTYSNECVPYFHPSELRKTDVLTIYRDTHNYVNHGKFRRVEEKIILSEIDVSSQPVCKFYNIRKRIGKNEFVDIPDTVSVVFNKDFQDFVKRLRINLKRKYNYDIPLNYFYCSEYGPSTHRAHFHALFFVPFGCYSLFKNAISEAWPFDDYRQCRRNIQIAKNAAAYVSSYCNRSAIISELFGRYKETRPSHHYSQNFGVGKDAFSREKILESIQRRDLHYDRARYKGSSLVVDSVIIPKYVINRYFPKFTGYHRLAVDALRSIYERPTNIYKYRSVLGLDEEQCRRIAVLISHKQQLFPELTPYDYAIYASSVWTIYSSNVLKDFYENVNLYSFLESYDNLSEITYENQPFIFEYMLDNERFFENVEFYELNDFPSIIHKTQVLEELYYKYSKDKKVRNHIYSHFINI